MGKKFFWIKLKDSFFNQLAIKKLRKVAGGDTFVIIYLKMMLLSMNENGTISYECEPGEFVENLSLEIDEDEENVKMTLAFLKANGLVENVNDKEVFLVEVPGCTGVETAEAEKKRKQRKLPKLTNGCVRVNAEMVRLPNGTVRYVDEKRYGGNGMFVLDRAGCKCEKCGSEENIVIHHNNGYSNAPEDLMVLCKGCHAKLHASERKGTQGGQCPPLVPSNVLLEKEIDIEIDKDIDIDKDIVVVVNNIEQPPPKDLSKLVDFWNKNIHPITPFEFESLRDLATDYGPLVVQEAMLQACSNNVRKLSYVKAAAEGIANGEDSRKPKQESFDEVMEQLRRKYEEEANGGNH